MVVDGGDLSCARLLVRLRAVVLGLPPGAVVHLETADPVAPIDLPAWCRLTGHVYLGPVESPTGRPRYAVQVAEAARATDPDVPWRVVRPTE